MKPVSRYDQLLKSIVVLLLVSERVIASTITASPSATAVPSIAVQSNGTCEFRTINYITDTLPQQCLKSVWRASNTTTAKPGETTFLQSDSAGNITATVTEAAPDSSAIETLSAEHTTSISNPDPELSKIADEDLEAGEFNEASFLSFEEWKKQTLDKEKELSGNKKSADGKKKDGEEFQNHLEHIDEGELEVDLSGFKAGVKSEGRAHNVEKEIRNEHAELEFEEKPKKRDQYRSKDAGKTCKERFSYASFDAGATVVKTHKGAKNAKSVLIENKDSYMLSECSEANKFMIIELSEDIWIDTLVLANYEFFSSMIRTFRVSLSDRYPVPISKWKDLGTYEARNSRDIQAFLIENPQIWARYIRIEFLSHFGNEYYCPLSLVRVHGTRMLESWKMEGSSEDEEESEEVEGPAESEGYIPEAVAQVVKEEEERLKAVGEEVVNTAKTMAQEAAAAVDAAAEDNKTSNVIEAPTTSWKKQGFYIFELDDINEQEDISRLSDAPVEEFVLNETQPVAINSTKEISPLSSSALMEASKTSIFVTTSVKTTERPSKEASPVSVSSQAAAAVNATSTSSSSLTPSSSSTSMAAPHAKSNATSSSIYKNKTATATTSASSSLPTIQESFFKAVSRRLSLLESNSTLSLAYISEQSKLLREAFNKVEKKQLQKTTTFLDTLNTTVLAELRGFRQQYDEIWQSTVISLESQREESRRELLAVSERLGILGEEVVWQRRMSIVQSVLLILCLGLVIFSRVSSTDSLPFYASRRSRTFQEIESPLEGEWLERPRTSDETTGASREPSRSPPSTSYTRELTPPSEEMEGTTHLLPSSPSLEIPNPMLRRTKSVKSTSGDSSYLSSSPARPIPLDQSPFKENGEASPSSTPTKKKRKNSMARRRGLSQSSVTPTATPPLASAATPNPFNILASPSSSPLLRKKKSQLHTPEPTPEPEEEMRDTSAVGDGGSGDTSATSPISKRFSIARKPLPALPGSTLED